MTDREAWVSTGQAARMLGVRSINTVKRLIRGGKLRAIRPGGHYRIAVADVRALAAGPATAGAAPASPRSADPLLIDAWARRHGVARLILFGSGARDQLRPGSDLDFAFELLPGRSIGLFEHVEMRDELADLFRAPVDLGTLKSLKPSIRRRVDTEGVTLHAAR